MSAERNVLWQWENRMETAVCQADALPERHPIRIDRQQIIVLAITQDARGVNARHDTAAADCRRMAAGLATASCRDLRGFYQSAVTESSSSSAATTCTSTSIDQRPGPAGRGDGSFCCCCFSRIIAAQRLRLGRTWRRIGGQSIRWGKLNGPFGCTQLPVDIGVLADAVLEIRHLRL